MAAPKSILLTGATGFLGSRLLVDLLHRNPTATVFCHVRANPSCGDSREWLQTQLAAFGVWGRVPPSSWSRVVVMEGDTTEPNFGVSDADKTRLQHSITSIVHSAASISLKAHQSELLELNTGSVTNAVELAKMCVAGKRPPSIHLVSSIAAVCNVNPGGVIPESLDTSSNDAVAGYGLSKWHAEQALRTEAASNGIAAYVYRTPFILGDIVPQEKSIPTVTVQLACVLGAMPRWQSDIPMFPIAHLSQAISTCALREPSDEEYGKTRVFHLFEQDQKSFDQQAELLITAGVNADIVSVEEWLRRLHVVSQLDTYVAKLASISPIVQYFASLNLGSLQSDVTYEWLAKNCDTRFDPVGSAAAADIYRPLVDSSKKLLLENLDATSTVEALRIAALYGSEA